MKEYIEREAAIHAITDTMENYSTFSTERCACIIERQKIKNLPAANVAPVRHGRWIHPHWCNDVSAANCSECGAEAQHREYRGAQKYYKVCPSCGALMDTNDALQPKWPANMCSHFRLPNPNLMGGRAIRYG